MGTQPPPLKGGGAPSQFSTYFHCGQTAGCIKMPLGTEVGFSQGHIVLDGDLAPQTKRRHSSPTFQFQPMSIVAKRSPISATAELLLHSSLQSAQIPYNGPSLHSKLPLRIGDLNPHLIHGMVLCVHPSPHPKRHLGRLSRFCSAYDCDRPTDRPTDRQTTLLGR